MKLIILTQYYPPEHGAPQNRLHDLAKRCVAAGHQVTVMTAMPNYPKGKIFPEYRGSFTKRENIDGVDVVRSWIFTSKSKGKIPQLCVYFSFVFSAILAGIFRLRRADYLICESPPLFLGFTALILKFFKRAKLVMNISDLWPESAVQLGMIGPGMALSILEWFEKLLYKKSSLVMCQTEGIVTGVKKSYTESTTLLFPNGVDLEMFTPGRKDAKLAKEFGIEDADFIVGYGGNHGRSQALIQVLKAADIVKKQNKKVKFLLCGDGPEKIELIEKAEEMKLENIKFIDSQPREKMSEIQALWDIALVPLKNIELFDGARPSKMFELMAGEIPFIFCGKGEGADLAEQSGCARIVPPEDSAKLAETVLELAPARADSSPVSEPGSDRPGSRPGKLAESRRKDMGKEGRKFVEKNFNRAKLADELMKELEEVGRS